MKNMKAETILLQTLEENGYGDGAIVTKGSGLCRSIVEAMQLYAEKKSVLTAQRIDEIALQEYPLKLQSGLMSKEGYEPEKVEFDMNKNQREIFKAGLERAVKEMKRL